jgi:quercetin dioxygenase-like cupin family protein
MTLYGNWGRQHFRPEQNIFLIEEHPLKEGPIIMRILLPAGYIIPAHFHPGAERSTVISGTYNMGRKHSNTCSSG